MNGIIERGKKHERHEEREKLFLLLFNIFSSFRPFPPSSHTQYNNVIFTLLYFFFHFIKVKLFAFSADVEQIHLNSHKKESIRREREIVDGNFYSSKNEIEVKFSHLFNANK